jgi:hypothetical protein
MLTISNKRNEFFKILHIDKSYKDPVFSPDSNEVDEGYATDNLLDYSWYYNYMLNESYPFIVMAGEFDVRDGAFS